MINEVNDYKKSFITVGFLVSCKLSFRAQVYAMNLVIVFLVLGFAGVFAGPFIESNDTIYLNCLKANGLNFDNPDELWQAAMNHNCPEICKYKHYAISGPDEDDELIFYPRSVIKFYARFPEVYEECKDKDDETNCELVDCMDNILYRNVPDISDVE